MRRLLYSGVDDSQYSLLSRTIYKYMYGYVFVRELRTKVENEKYALYKSLYDATIWLFILRKCTLFETKCT